MKTAALTQKQEAFALAYVETGNAAEAYRRAYDVDVECSPKRPYGFYVYAIVDVADWNICYVGKGKGGRMHQHLRAHRAGRFETRKKHDGLNRLISGGAILSPFCIEDGLSDRDALSFERMLIRAIGHDKLLNSMYGVTTANERAIAKADALISALSVSVSLGGCRAVMAGVLRDEAIQARNLAAGLMASA